MSMGLALLMPVKKASLRWIYSFLPIDDILKTNDWTKAWSYSLQYLKHIVTILICVFTLCIPQHPYFRTLDPFIHGHDVTVQYKTTAIVEKTHLLEMQSTTVYSNYLNIVWLFLCFDRIFMGANQTRWYTDIQTESSKLQSLLNSEWKQNCVWVNHLVPEFYCEEVTFFLKNLLWNSKYFYCVYLCVDFSHTDPNSAKSVYM